MGYRSHIYSRMAGPRGPALTFFQAARALVHRTIYQPDLIVRLPNLHT
ncbi:hypothetical protein LCGC14_2602350, partial [marine sediment metagenome]